MRLAGILHEDDRDQQVAPRPQECERRERREGGPAERQQQAEELLRLRGAVDLRRLEDLGRQIRRSTRTTGTCRSPRSRPRRRSRARSGCRLRLRSVSSTNSGMTNTEAGSAIVPTTTARIVFEMRPRCVRNQNAPPAEIRTSPRRRCRRRAASGASPRRGPPRPRHRRGSASASGCDGSATELSWNSAMGFTAVPIEERERVEERQRREQQQQRLRPAHLARSHQPEWPASGRRRFEMFVPTRR